MKTTGPEILTSANNSGTLVKTFIAGNIVGDALNAGILDSTTDGAPDLMSKTAALNYFKFFPAGFSFNGMDHYRQFIEHGKFCRRDRYDGNEPEEYDLTKIKAQTKICLVTG